MSKNDQEWFVAQRSRALALMYLTRRQDLVIKEVTGTGIGLEWEVTLTREGREGSLRKFGALVRGAKNPVTEKHLNNVLTPMMEGFSRAGQFPYPVCLLYFTMDDDQGYYVWVAEPAVESGVPRLLMHTEAHCRKLDRVALDEIVALVDRWYDAFFDRIAVKVS
jgi:hypothetical protein